MPGLAAAPSTPLTGPSLDNRRIAAALIDGAIVGLILLVLRTLTGGFDAVTLALGAAWALYYYFASEWGADGQTLGKRLMGLRVVRDDGGKPSIREIALRTVLRLVDGLGFYLVGLATMIASGERRQRIGDLVARTVVTAADAVPTAAVPPPAVDPRDELEEPELPPQLDPEPAPEPPPPEPPLANPPPVTTVEVPDPPIADEPEEARVVEPPIAPPRPAAEPEDADPEPQIPAVPPPPPPLEDPAHEPAPAPDVPVPPPPPPPAAEETAEVRTENIEIASAIDLVMADEDEDAKRAD